MTGHTNSPTRSVTEVAPVLDGQSSFPSRRLVSAGIPPVTVVLCCVWFSPQARARPTARAKAWAEALRGAARAAGGDFDGAAGYLRRSLALQESTPLRAALYLSQPTAYNLEKLERLARTKGTDAAIHYWTARLFLCTNPAKACRILEAAASLAPRSAKVLLAEGLACRASRPKTARRALEELTRVTWDILDPRLYPDRISGLLELVSTALKDYPDQPSLLVTMAHLHMMAGHLRQAEELARRTLALRHAQPEALFVLARAQYQAGWHKAAKQSLRRLLAQRPSDPQGLALDAALAMETGQKAKAVAALETSVRANPTDPVTLSRLGKLLWDQGSLARAEKMFRYALARMPDFAPAHYGVALALVHRKRITEARDHFLAAIAASPNDPVYRKGYAFFLQQRGKIALARKENARADALTRALRRLQKKTQSLRSYRLALVRAAKKLGQSRHQGLGARPAHAGNIPTVRLPRGPALVRRFLLAHFHPGRRSSVAVAVGRLSARKLLCRARSVNELRLTAPVPGSRPLSVLVHLDFADPRLF